MSEDVLEILFGLCNGESLHCLGSLVGVFIMDAEIPGRSFSDWIGRALPLEVEGFLE